jgi:hypothetical protein
LQLRKSDVPELGFPPGADLFQLLWCPQDHPEPLFIVAPRVFWRKASSVRNALRKIPKPPIQSAEDDEEDYERIETSVRIDWLKSFAKHPDYLEQMLHAPVRERKQLQKELQLPFFEPCSPSELRKLKTTIRRTLQELEGSVREPAFALDNYVPVPCRLFPERVAEFPFIEDLPTKVGKMLDQASDLPAHKEVQERIKAYRREGEIQNEDEFIAIAYERELSVADGTKVGGYVHWIQGSETPKCRCGKKMEHLLTIASNECDAANWRRWLPKEDRHLWGKSWSKSEKAINAPDIMLGDVGSLYLFICRKCKGWPVRSVFQCC